MGYSGRILVARPAVERDLEVVLASHGFGTHTPREAGWIEAEADGAEPRTADIDGLIRDLQGPVLVADVTTSDFAVVTAAAPGVDPTTVILTPKAFRAEGLPVPSTAETKGSYRTFAAWSSAAPIPVDAARLQALVRRGATLAEDVVWELFSMLGIAPIPGFESQTRASDDVLQALALTELGGYLRPLSDMTTGGPGRDWATERFVMGYGDGFIGVWDRQRPDGPTFRFEPNSRGFDHALEAWSGMAQRLELGHDADAFEGLIGICEQGSFSPGGRYLAPQDWRFIPGWGDGFAAVWDRESGAEPVVRFKGSSLRAKERALAWARDATMRLLAARKVLGPDRWISGHEEDPWDPSGYSRAKVFLVAFEEADVDWPPSGLEGLERDGYVLHAIWKLADGLDIHACAQRPSTDPELFKHETLRWGARGDWLRVPDEVPRTLLETARWAVEDSPLAATLIPFRSG